MTSGVHELSAEVYHADPCERPSLTASTIKTLCTQSPLHAWGNHPRLNPAFTRHEDDKFDLGTAAHQLLLEGDDAMFVVEADDWRTKDAKEARALARADGRIPMLAKHAAEVRVMVDAIWEQAAKVDVRPALFQDGKPEQTMVWEEDGVLCRARLDWLHDDRSAIDDLKTCRASAEPRAWSRTMLGMGAELQARFYQRGLRALTGREPEFRFVVVEVTAPYALSVVSLAPSLAALADVKIDWALATWKRCLDTGEFPGYTPRVAYVEAQPWDETRWLEREGEEEYAA